jgi:hypothetical protein
VDGNRLVALVSIEPESPLTFPPLSPSSTGFFFFTNNPEGIRMAARLRKFHSDEIRAKIQASQLINVLQNHALNGEDEMPASRMKAIEILLRKSVPDLSAIQISGDEDNPLHHAITLEVKGVSANIG